MFVTKKYKIIFISSNLKRYFVKFLYKIRPSIYIAINLKELQKGLFFFEIHGIDIFHSWQNKKTWQKISCIFTMCAKRRLSINNLNSLPIQIRGLIKKIRTYLFFFVLADLRIIISQIFFSVWIFVFHMYIALFKFCIKSLF